MHGNIRKKIKISSRSFVEVTVTGLEPRTT